jgi:hypothetical protein
MSPGFWFGFHEKRGYLLNGRPGKTTEKNRGKDAKNL